MAHRSSVIQVLHGIGQVDRTTAEPELVVDPACGVRIDRRGARQMLFRGDATYYFCSRECRDRFIHKGKAGGLDRALNRAKAA